MHRRVLALALVLVLAITLPAIAQNSSKGKYVTHITSLESSEMSDGRTMQVQHYRQYGLSESEDDPMANTMADCIGLLILAEDQTPASASGACFGRDADGNGLSFWWRLEKAGTPDCPINCGSWGYFSGDGELQGITGTGTWKNTTAYADGGFGMYEGTYSLK